METEYIPMRDGYGKALLKMCAGGEDVMVLDADVSKSTRTNWVHDKYPGHFLNMGISEQDMVGTAAGLALAGSTVFVSTYCVFLCGRAWDQIRTTVCYNNLNVKFGGAHAGISVGPDGATHQSLEDIALMRVLPHMTVLAPCDALETEKAALAAAKYPGPVFLRFGREPVPVTTAPDSPFEIGRANVLRPGSDVAIAACGAEVWQALRAAEVLAAQGISARVINMHTIKPLDGDCLLRAAAECGALVTAEEHQINGGLGGAAAEFLAANFPVPQEFVAVRDSFGESGTPDELIEKYGLAADAIVLAALRAVSRKR